MKEKNKVPNPLVDSTLETKESEASLVRTTADLLVEDPSPELAQAVLKSSENKVAKRKN